jgi:putative flippase GtrA
MITDASSSGEPSMAHVLSYLMPYQAEAASPALLRPLLSEAGLRGDNHGRRVGLTGRWRRFLQEQIDHARRLKRLFEQKAGRLAHPAQFALVGLSGMGVDLLAFALLGLWLPLGIARALAIWLAMTWNYALNRRVTFSACRQHFRWRDYALFCGGCLAGAVVSWSLCVGLCAASAWLARYSLLAALLGVAAGFVLNYSLSRRFVFRPETARISPAQGMRPQTAD